MKKIISIILFCLLSASTVFAGSIPSGSIPAFFGTAGLDFYMNFENGFTDGSHNASPMATAGSPTPALTTQSIVSGQSVTFTGNSSQRLYTAANWAVETGTWLTSSASATAAYNAAQDTLRADLYGVKQNVDVLAKVRFATSIGSNNFQILARSPSGVYNQGYALTVTSSALRIDKTGTSILATTAFTPSADTDYIPELVITGSTITAIIWDATLSTKLATTTVSDATYTQGYVKYSAGIAANNGSSVVFSAYTGPPLYAGAGNSPVNYEITQPWTMFAWGKFSSLGKSANMILAKIYANGTSPAGWHWYYRKDGTNYFQAQSIVNAPSYTLAREGTINLNDNTIHFLATTYDGSNTLAGIKLFTDCIEESYTTVVNLGGMPTILNSAALQVGSKDDGGADDQVMNGTLDETAIYSRVISPSAIGAYCQWARNGGHSLWFLGE